MRTVFSKSGTYFKFRKLSYYKFLETKKLQRRLWFRSRIVKRSHKRIKSLRRYRRFRRPLIWRKIRMIRLNRSLRRQNIFLRLVSKKNGRFFTRFKKLNYFYKQYGSLLKQKFTEINKYDSDIIKSSKLSVLKQLKVGSVANYLSITKKHLNIVNWAKRVQN